MRSWCTLLVAASLLAGAPVRAQVDAGVDPSALVHQAEDAEARAAPREALAAWHALVDGASTSRLARRGRERIAWLEARGEGNYAPLAALMAFLGTTPATRTAEVVGAFERTTDAMPAGRVRIESRIAVASEWARLGDLERARRQWQEALDDPELTPGEGTLVRESMARALVDLGHADAAMDELDAAGMQDTSLRRFALRRERAVTLVPLSWSLFALFVIVAMAIVARSGRAADTLRALAAPRRLAIALYAGGGPALIVAWWGDEALLAFAAFVPVAFVIVIASFAVGIATDDRRARAVSTALALAATVAGAYLVLEAYGEALPFV
jgi:hypothetical protein